MKKNIYFLLLFFSKLSIACQCPTLDPISVELLKNYDVIFYGKVDSVNACPKNGISTAYFTINELYKGSVGQHLKLDFDCSSACMMSFSKDDEWLIYATFQRFDLITVNICEHSRKFFGEASQDIYQIAAARTFEQEKQFLKNTLSIQPYAKNNELNTKQNELGPRNEQPSAMNKLWLLLTSVLVMAIVYFVTRNKKKNDK